MTPLNKRWGQIIDHTLYKIVQESKHLHRKKQAWGFDEELIQEAELMGVSDIVLHDTETGLYYKSDINHFLDHADLDMYGKNGWQYFLPLEYWEITS